MSSRWLFVWRAYVVFVLDIRDVWVPNKDEACKQVNWKHQRSSSKIVGIICLSINVEYMRRSWRRVRFCGLGFTASYDRHTHCYAQLSFYFPFSEIEELLYLFTDFLQLETIFIFYLRKSFPNRQVHNRICIQFPTSFFPTYWCYLFQV